MHKDDDKIQRRALVTGMGAAIAGLSIGASRASAQTGSNAYRPARHDIDAWFGDKPSTHRVFIDSNTPEGGTNAPRYASNIMNAHKDVYGGSDDDYSMVVCFRHMSTPFGYKDNIWEKYGEIMVGLMMDYTDPGTGKAPARNLLNGLTGPFSGASLDALSERGVRFAVCRMATLGLSGMIAGATNQKQDDVFAELESNLVTNARLVPAGVMAATRSQEYGYSLLSAG